MTKTELEAIIEELMNYLREDQKKLMNLFSGIREAYDIDNNDIQLAFQIAQLRFTMTEEKINGSN